MTLRKKGGRPGKEGRGGNAAAINPKKSARLAREGGISKNIRVEGMWIHEKTNHRGREKWETCKCVQGIPGLLKRNERNKQTRKRKRCY